MIIGEVAVIVTVVGWFVTPNITKLIEVAHSCASGKYESHRGMSKKLLKLAKDLVYIKGVVDKVSLRFITDQTWTDHLWLLKDDIHDAEEILDSFEYKILEANLKKHHSVKKACDAFEVSKKLEKLLSCVPFLDGRGWNFVPLSKKKLEKLLKNLSERRKEARELLQDSQHTSTLRPFLRTETGPYPVKDKELFFGYKKEYDQLSTRLLDGIGKDVVIAIVGHGGMGKTELARQVFRDVKGKFDLRIWVHAYNKFTETELLREIWNGVPGNAPCGEMNVSRLQRELEELVDSKTYLLVLDDVWNDESATNERQKQAWDTALAPFKYFGGEGSKILMTTRAKICSTTLNAGATIVLNGIDTKEITLMLKETAKPIDDCSVSKKATDGGPWLLQERQLKKIVPKLKGSPLAAQEIGGKLKKTKRHEREKIIDGCDHHINSVFSDHWLTYHHLPPHLQRCFAFCSVFPYNWRFEPEKLIKMWIAHGFIGDSSGGGMSMEMEDVARGYIDDLVQHSLFEEVPDGVGGKETKYVIHEHIHSMIRQVSARYCVSVDGTRSTAPVPLTARHLSVSSGCLDQLKAFSGRLENIRTVLVFKDDPSSTSSPLSAIDSDIIKEFKGVRVLDLTDTGITELPESIGNLKHLRYLGLPGTMTKLRAQVTMLLLLQTLGVGKNCELDEFPDDMMSNLINLRHLDLDINYIAKMSSIGSLGRLQGSVEFHAGRTKGHRMSELAAMNSLRRTLSIKGLENVASNKEAQDAQLTSKKSLKVLKLEWGHPNPRLVGGSSDSDAVLEGPRPPHDSDAVLEGPRPPHDSDAVLEGPRPPHDSDAVLEGLRPPPSLRELRITRYPGTKSPTWLANDSCVLGNLRRLYLRNCRKLQALPPVGMLPCLKLLDVKELCSVERIDRTFCGNPGTALEEIVLVDMPKLVAWDAEVPTLREVAITDCPLIASLSGLGCCHRSLRSLRVERCPEITEASLPTNFTRSGFPSLTGLLIVGCTLQLEALPEGSVLSSSSPSP